MCTTEVTNGPRKRHRCFHHKSDISKAFLYVSIKRERERNNFDADVCVEFASDDNHVILQEGIFMQYARSTDLIIFGVI
jgi:predicted nucleotidyltransferase